MLPTTNYQQYILYAKVCQGVHRYFFKKICIIFLERKEDFCMKKGEISLGREGEQKLLKTTATRKNHADSFPVGMVFSRYSELN